MKTSTFVKAVTLAAAASLLFTGCASGGGGNSATNGTAVWNEPTASLEGVTLTFGGGTVSDPGLTQVMDAFTEATGAEFDKIAYPDPYEQSLLTKVAVGDMPDLAAWQPTASQLTTLQPSKNLLSLDDAPWLDELDPAVKDVTGFVGDTRYAALVTSPSVMGVYYNKGLFAQYGITEAPADWAEFIADAQSIKDQGGVPFYEAGGDRWPTQWWPQVQLAEQAQAGLWDRVNTNEEQFTSPAILDAITEYKSLIDAGLFNSDIKTATVIDQANAVLTGEAAMAVQVNALLLQMQSVSDTETIDANVGWFPISQAGNIATSIPDNKNGVVAFHTGDAKQEAAAAQFLNFWMTTDYADYVEAANAVSIKPDVDSPAGVPEVAKLISASLGSSVGSMQSLAVANADLYLNMAKMIQGTQTPKQVAEATQRQFAGLAQAQGIDGF
ncbi:ABC transporter substrate-binding protein [Cryobacterium sp.]|jgi:raffinose/stachyose/melibiose transport system substrate-binding protein|uniref:ABC transporter substrate-binding protein n=1 Tax=Cryobacterium sp. TaxID=1926290 RepID=UPI0026218CB4|nr:extracellular solute-binding protein [Cryobacterium sp.]MCU1444439.1 sugar-binding protein [Cryobacterium sp.]